MASLVEYMVLRGHTNMIALAGNNQSNTISEYIQKRASKGFQNELIVKEKKVFDF